MPRWLTIVAVLVAGGACSDPGYQGRITFVREEVGVRILEEACDCEPRPWMPNQCNIWTDTSDFCGNDGSLDSAAVEIDGDEVARDSAQHGSGCWASVDLSGVEADKVVVVVRGARGVVRVPVDVPPPPEPFELTSVRQQDCDSDWCDTTVRWTPTSVAEHVCVSWSSAFAGGWCCSADDGEQPIPTEHWDFRG